MAKQQRRPSEDASETEGRDDPGCSSEVAGEGSRSAAGAGADTTYCTTFLTSPSCFPHIFSLLAAVALPPPTMDVRLLRIAKTLSVSQFNGIAKLIAMHLWNEHNIVVVLFHVMSGHLIIFIGVVVIIVPAILPFFVLPVTSGLFSTGIDLSQPIHHTCNEAS